MRRERGAGGRRRRLQAHGAHHVYSCHAWRAGRSCWLVHANGKRTRVRRRGGRRAGAAAGRLRRRAHGAGDGAGWGCRAAWRRS
jgi:hypothetical protein